jgi:hypothetical protein
LRDLDLHIQSSVTAGGRVSAAAAHPTAPVVGTPLMDNEWVDI